MDVVDIHQKAAAGPAGDLDQEVDLVPLVPGHG